MSSGRRLGHSQQMDGYPGRVGMATADTTVTGRSKSVAEPAKESRWGGGDLEGRGINHWRELLEEAQQEGESCPCRS